MTNPNDRIEQVRHGWLTGDGLTKREYFAAMAMQGLLADESMGGKSEGYRTLDKGAEQAVRYADALIAALNK